MKRINEAEYQGPNSSDVARVATIIETWFYMMDVAGITPDHVYEIGEALGEDLSAGLTESTLMKFISGMAAGAGMSSTITGKARPYMGM